MYLILYPHYQHNPKISQLENKNLLEPRKKKKLLLSIESWLVHRGPYNSFLWSLYNLDRISSPSIQLNRPSKTSVQPSCMGFVPPGIIFCHTLGNITAQVEFCCIQMSNSHLPAHISTGDICNGLKPWVKYFEYFEVWKLKPKEGFEVDYHGLSGIIINYHGLSINLHLNFTARIAIFWMTILTALVWICSGA